jgi:hypothetical protein
MCPRRGAPTVANRATRRKAGGLRALTLASLLSTQFPPRPYLFSPVLKQGESMMLWAPSGVGKTMLALTVALAVAGGGTVLDWSAPSPRRVLLIDGEMHAEDLQERLRMLSQTVTGLDADAAGGNMTVVARQYQDAAVPFPDLASPKGQNEVIQLIESSRSNLVILDNLSTLAELEDENDAAKMQPVLSFLMRLKQRGTACILIHHSGKSGATFRGSSKLATTFEVILGLKPAETQPGTYGMAFETEWTKYRGKKSAAVEGRRMWLEETEGALSWSCKLAGNEEARRLVGLVQSGKYRTQVQLADAMPCATGKLSGLKHRAFRLNLISEEEWDECLSGGSDLPADF